jgi:hypothetical protein
VISCKISSLRLFLWTLVGSLVSFIIVLLGSGTGNQENGFHPFFFFPSSHLELCNYVLDRLVGGFSHLFPFPWFNLCVMAVLVVS